VGVMRGELLVVHNWSSEDAVVYVVIVQDALNLESDEGR
jgi:hypothetical protein